MINEIFHRMCRIHSIVADTDRGTCPPVGGNHAQTGKKSEGFFIRKIDCVKLTFDCVDFQFGDKKIIT
jgi:hypothetical protein